MRSRQAWIIAAALLALFLEQSPSWAQGYVTRVSVGPGGTQSDNDSWGPAVSGDGRFVAFASAASNLVEGDTNAAWDVFVRDRETGTTTRISVSTEDVQGDADSYEPAKR